MLPALITINLISTINTTYNITTILLLLLMYYYLEDALPCHFSYNRRKNTPSPSTIPSACVIDGLVLTEESTPYEVRPAGVARHCFRWWCMVLSQAARTCTMEVGIFIRMFIYGSFNRFYDGAPHRS